MKVSWLFTVAFIACGAAMIYAVIQMHLAACDLHVWAVERMSNANDRAQYQAGIPYRACKWYGHS